MAPNVKDSGNLVNTSSTGGTHSFLHKKEERVAKEISLFDRINNNESSHIETRNKR